MADIDINDLTQARFMGLMWPASSPRSKLLVNDLVDILIKTEQRQRARKADDMAAFRNGISLIMGDLLIAMEVKALFGRAFQVAFGGATNLVARNQMQPVTMCPLFVGEQQFSGYALCEKKVRFGG